MISISDKNRFPEIFVMCIFVFVLMVPTTTEIMFVSKMPYYYNIVSRYSYLENLSNSFAEIFLLGGQIKVSLSFLQTISNHPFTTSD